MPENTSSSSQKGRIFISYRRADSEGYAGRIYDRLVLHFGDDAIFMDVDDIPAGVDFVKYLENEVQSCNVLIALIGKQWLNVKDEHGIRRLDDPNDFVRIEIATALKRDIRVIPVLLGGTQMPNISDLPENLQSLTRRNGLLVYHHSFHADTNRLIKHLEDALRVAEKERQRIANEKLDRDAAEKAAKEKAEREAAAKAAKEKAEKEAAEKAAKEKAEYETAEREKVELEATEKAAREKEIKRRLEESIKKARRDLWWGKLKINIRYHFRMIYIYRVPILILLVTLAFVTPLLIRLSNLIPGTIAAFNNDPTAAIELTLSPQPGINSTKAFTPLEILTPSPTSTEVLVATPTSLPTGIMDAKGVEMVLVPAGEFVMGSNTLPIESPIHNVFLDDFYIDKYEVTVLRYKACENAGVCLRPLNTFGLMCSDASHCLTGAPYYYHDKWSDYPVNNVNWDMAKAYCEWRGAYLPTEAQWEKAARGTDGRTYPWGEGIDCIRANYSLCSTKNYTNTNFFQVGSFPDGASPYDVYDLAGNVWEWVADWYGQNYYKNSPLRNPLGPDSGDYKIVRGGAALQPNDPLRSTYRRLKIPSSYDNFVGFRCAKDANQ